LYFSETRFDFSEPSAHRFNDPWIVCRAFLFSFGDHLNPFDRFGNKELRATQRVVTHTCLPPFSLTLIPTSPALRGARSSK